MKLLLLFVLASCTSCKPAKEEQSEGKWVTFYQDAESNLESVLPSSSRPEALDPSFWTMDEFLAAAEDESPWPSSYHLLETPVRTGKRIYLKMCYRRSFDLVLPPFEDSVLFAQDGAVLVQIVGGIPEEGTEANRNEDQTASKALENIRCPADLKTRAALEAWLLTQNGLEGSEAESFPFLISADISITAEKDGELVEVAQGWEMPFPVGKLSVQSPDGDPSSWTITLDSTMISATLLLQGDEPIVEKITVSQ